MKTRNKIKSSNELQNKFLNIAPKLIRCVSMHGSSFSWRNSLFLPLILLAHVSIQFVPDCTVSKSWNFLGSSSSKSCREEFPFSQEECEANFQFCIVWICS